MKTKTRNHLWRFGLAIMLLCLCSVQAIAGVAKPVPTGPKDPVTGTWAVPDYNTTANWAYSPPLTKFVDKLPGLGKAKANALGNYLTIANPDTVTYPGSDYYEIDLVEFSQQLHSDLPAGGTKLRGYVQVNRGTATTGGGLCGNPQRACTAADNTVNPEPVKYLGPSIVAQRDRPVRIKFTNRLAPGAAGDLFIPVDTTLMGAGKGPAFQGATRGQGAACDNTIVGNTCASYTQNRATLHLHGGRTPWISDGTPHQWMTPATENTPYPKGVSVQNVPDMPDPGDGSLTFYYSNQQSARLMFYHDHAFGITRLNVYAGEASGYLITDQYEQDLIARGVIPPEQIPLIIQDKTFVDAAKIRTSDPLWNWGSGAPDVNGIRPPVTGDLWLPHVYMPNQNPYNPDGSGINPFGRWFYGPWFMPPTVITNGPIANPYFDADCLVPNSLTCTTPGQPPLIPATPHPSMGMEAFMDTPIVNGAPYPVLEVDARAYRFRILNAANDRGLNLSLFKPDPIAAPADPRRLDNRTEVAMLPAAPTTGWPALWPTDGRAGGVPDPATQGPSWIQIGTDGGFLPKPAIRPPQPITYVTDPTAFWFGVVKDTSLALMPAERADVIVDFSAYAGQTLILYNDAPTAWPAMDPRYDFYTGAPDQRSTGGYGTGGTFDPITQTWVGGTGPLPGVGPNTHTIMQIVVRATPVDPPYTFNQANLDTEFTSLAPVTAVNPAPAKPLFQRAQEPIIVAQAEYQAAYPATLIPTAYPWWGLRSSLNQHSLSFITTEGKPVVVPMEPKGIHDEMGASFDPVYGRMSGNLAMQIPNPTTLNALLILYGYSDLPSETIINSPAGPVKVSATVLQTLADGTQIWDISHNGVDTHPIHFHIFDVQLINRLGWDGRIARPDPNELGWKDTVRISPLMDTIVAVRPVAPLLPFGIANSLRPLNPAIPINSAMGFNNVDWLTGQARPTPVTNVMTSFGWEYVWHCHILSHEEMDMMRPIVLTVTNTVPPAPTLSSVTAGAVLTWVDPTPAATSLGNPQNEIGFKIQRCFGSCTAASAINTSTTNQFVSNQWTNLTTKALANATTFTDTAPLVTGIRYYYRVSAYNAAGTSPYSNIVNRVVGTRVKPVASLTAPADGAQVLYGTNPVTISATATATTGLKIASISIYVNGALYGTGTFLPTAVAPFNYSYNWTTATPGTYVLTATATDTNGVVSLVSASRTITVVQSEPPASITVPAGSANGSYTVSWGASPTATTLPPVTYMLEESTTPAFTTVTPINAGAALSATITGKANGTVYYYRVMAVSPTLGNSTYTVGANGCVVSYPTVAPASIYVPATSTNGVYTVTWGASTTVGATYTLEESTFANFPAASTTVVAGIIGLSSEIRGKTNGTYYYRVKAVAAGFSTFPYTTAANGCTVTLAPALVTMPAFSKQLLTGASQTPWENIIPNALADYFTYVPYTTADAVKLGFPATCGNIAKGDITSTEDCYTITARKFAQPLAVQGIFGGGPGLRDAGGNPVTTTQVYGYGSGGQLWTPPYVDTTKPGVTAGVQVTGNAPTPFTDGTFATSGIWHFPAPTIKGTRGRPIRVQWLNDLPNEAPTGLDPSVDCGTVALNCYPYNRITTHVHGAHVGPESDGLTSAWFTPNFAIKGEDFVSTRQHGPEGTYYYPMDQEASTIWYHDHAMGTTHNNTNMGLAGFFPITDTNEQALKAANVLPSGPYELGFALQDRHFDNNGQLAMPDYPVYDLTTPGCTLTVDGLADPTTCKRIDWMKAADGHFIPFVAGDPLLLNANNIGTPGVVQAPFSAAGAGAPYGAPSATLEYFGNMPVVNGVVYGKTNVEPRVYRMRFIGGTDSRTWVMQLKRTDTNAIIPIWVIGSEQGLLNNPVPRQELDLMPGERADVLVDFTGMPAGTRVMMKNLGPDTPWSGYFDYTAGFVAPSLDIPEIMAFDVNQPLNTAIPVAATPAATTVLRPVIPAIPTPNNTRTISLMEITDNFGRTMPTIDSRGFNPAGMPVTEIIRFNDVEQWDIVNTTVDAHPMHLHQVAFQVVNRQPLAMDALGNILGFTPPGDNFVDQIFSQPTYTVGAAAIPPDAWDAGWKDTVASPPGYVTRVIAKFDITGTYVWHCHILSHEEHDMMRPMTVTDPLHTAPAPPTFTVPASSITGSYTLNWIGTAITGVNYELQEATALAGPYTTIYTGALPRFTVINKPTGSTFYYQVRAVPSLASGFINSNWKAGSNGITVGRTAITAPAAGNLTAGVITVTASVPVPTTPAGITVSKVEFYDNGVLLTDPVTAGASSTYSTLWTLVSGTHNLTAIAYFSNNVTSTSAAVTVTAATTAPTITLDTPATGTAFDLGTAITLAATPSAAANTTVAWVVFYDSVSALPLGIIDPTVLPFTGYTMSYTPATAGAHSLTAKVFYNNGVTATSAAAAVTINGTVIAPASITVPATSATGSYSVSWAAAVPATTGATYTLEESTDPTFATGVTTTTNAVSPVSISGKAGGIYYYQVKAVKAPMTDSAWVAGANGCVVPSAAAMATPANGTVLAGASQTFTWNNVGADLYVVWVGTTPGGNDIVAYPAGGTTATNITLSGLPTNGSTLYVRLWSAFGATWMSNDYTYTAVGTQVAAVMATPANNTVLAGASDTFTWNNVGASLYVVWVGTTPGGNDIVAYPAGGTTANNITLSGLPTNGSTLYVRLWSAFGGTWVFNDYTYTAGGTPAAAVMQTPLNNAVLGTSQTFSWNNVGANLYVVWVGTTPGGNDIVAYPAGGTAATSITLNGLPVGSIPLYVRLHSAFGPTWLTNDYVYTSAP